MKKKDIKPDVVMAIERTFGSPIPVKVLSAEMWTDAPRNHKKGEPWFRRAPAFSRPSRGDWSPDVGYPVVRLQSWSQQPTPAELAVLRAVTLEDFAKAEGTSVTRVPPGEPVREDKAVRLSLDVMTSLNQIQRLYAEANAAHEARAQREKAARDERDSAKELAGYVTKDLEERFVRLGIKARFKVTESGRLPLVMMVSARTASFMAEMLEAEQNDGEGGKSYVAAREQHDYGFARKYGLGTREVTE